MCLNIFRVLSVFNKNIFFYFLLKYLNALTCIFFILKSVVAYLCIMQNIFYSMNSAPKYLFVYLFKINTIDLFKYKNI